MMERSNDELCASIVALELVIDAARKVVSSGQLTPSDEEYVMLSLHPSTIKDDEIQCLFANVEDVNQLVAGSPDKREIQGLRSLVERELNETFSLIDKLENASGLTSKKDQLNEVDILTNVTRILESYANLHPELEKLFKRSKMTLQMIKEWLDPVVETSSSLKSELLHDISKIRKLESLIFEEKLKDVPVDVLERLVKDLETEVAALHDVPEVDEGQATAALKLKEVNDEIALKRAILHEFFPEG